MCGTSDGPSEFVQQKAEAIVIRCVKGEDLNVFNVKSTCPVTKYM